MPRKRSQATVRNGARVPVRKKAGKASGDLCQTLFEWSDEAVFLFDRAGYCLDVNPSGCRLFGLSRRKLQHRSLTEILLSHEGSEEARQIQGLRPGKTKACRARICRNDGCEIVVDVRAKGLKPGNTLVVLNEYSVSVPEHERLQESKRFLTKKVPIVSETGKDQYLLGLSEDSTELYQQRVREVERRQRLKRLMELSLMLSGDPAEVFDQAARIIGELFSVKVVCVSEISGRDLHFRSVCIGGQVFRDAGTCSLAETPCAAVEMTKDMRVFDWIMERFPEASFLKDPQALAYCGFPAMGSGGQVVAVTCLLDDKPHEFAEEDHNILRLFGQRIAVEVERARDMAERKGMEERLRASEARLEFLLSSNPAVIYSAKPSGDYGAMFVSDNVKKILGCPPEEFVADSRFWASRIHPDDRERVFAELPNLFEYGTFVHEYRFLHQDGTYRWLRDELQVIRNKDKQPVELIGCMTDISNRKQAELLLMQSEARFRHMVEYLPIGLASVDQNGRMTMVNAEMECLFGYQREELIGRSIDDLVPIRYRSRHASRLQAFMRNPQPVRLGDGRDLPGLRKDGTEIHLEIALTPINTAKGVQVVSSLVDITARKKAEAALLDERDRLRQILDSLFGFVALLSPDGIVEEVNHAPLLLLGLQRDEAIGRCFWDLGWVVPGHEGRIQAVVQAAAQGEVVRTEVMARFATIGDRFIDAVFSPILGSDGGVMSVVAFGIDDTERKQGEDALKAHEERLRLALRASKQGLYDLDLTTGKAEINDEYAMMLGYDPGEFQETNARWVERIHPDDRVKAQAAYQAYIRGESSSYEVEFRQRTKSGDWKWILSIGSIVARSADGQPLRMLGTHLDITERKLAEEERQRTFLLLRNIIDAIPDLIFVKDRELRTTLCNDSFAKAVGKDPNELIGRTDIENGWDPELVYGNHEKGIRGFETDDRDVLSGKVVHNLHDSANVNGQLRSFDTYKVPLVTESGDVIGVLGVSRDITDRMRMEEELRQREVRLQEAQHLAKIGNWELDLLSNRLVWSDEIFRIFEIEPSRFNASYDAFLNAIHPADRELVDETYRTSVAKRQPYALIHRLLMPDGRIKYVQEHGETDYDESFRPIRSRGTVQDVTARRLAELHTEISLREKETLLREVHHRVKNNLQIISSLLYFQSKKIRDPEDLSVFQEGQDRLASMILVHEKLYRSDDLMRIDFSDYARALIDHIRQSYRPVSARIDLVIDVPPIVVPVEVALPVGMIVNEALTNVFKYAFPNGREGRVRVAVTRSDGGIEVLVGDSGVGLPEGIDPERPTTFGLQLIHGLTSQLGGRITFETHEGISLRVSVPILQDKQIVH